MSRRVPAHVEPVIDRRGGGEIHLAFHQLRPDRRWLAIRAPAVGPDGRSGLQRLQLADRDRLARQGAFVQEIGVGQVQQVVGDQLVIGRDVHHAPDRGKAGGVITGKVGQQRLVRLVRIAHPDPDRAAPLDQRIGGHFHRGRDHPAAMRVEHALAALAEHHAVVIALHRVADPLAHVQRGEAVRAEIAHRHRIAVFLAIEQDRLFQDRAGFQRRIAQFMRPGGDVPCALQIHESLPA